MCRKLIYLVSFVLVLWLSSLARSDNFSWKCLNDARIDRNNGDNNYGQEGGNCCPGKDRTAFLMSWDFSSLAGWKATSDGKFNIPNVYWKQGELCACLYDLVGGPFDEDTVTYNNYVGASNPPQTVLGEVLDSNCADGHITFTVPQATIQGLIDGTIDGLALANPPAEWWNHCFNSSEASGVEPYLDFEAEFAAHLQAWKPNPPDGAARVSWAAIVSWNPGDNVSYVNGHDVYFGTAFNDVNDANTTVTLGVYKGSQDANSYDPGALEFGQTYYWRIDEVNDAHPDKLWQGDVWSFTVSDCLVVDNMESYGEGIDPGPPPPPGNRIWYTWKDGSGWTSPAPGWGGNGTGSVVDLSTSLTHEGSQALTCNYDNDGTNMFGDTGKKFYSEITADIANLGISADWTEAGVKALDLYFYGNPNNDANDPMYIVLEDGDIPKHNKRVVYDGDANDVKNEQWQVWRIALADFTYVNLANVEKITIGFGDPTAMTAGGAGTVHFDNIRLYPPRCLLRFRPKPDADFTGQDGNPDCIADFRELELMTDDWLNEDRIITIEPITAPADPCVLYKLEEGSGNTAVDAMGHYDAELRSPIWLAGGGYDHNNCLEFDDNQALGVPRDVIVNHIDTAMTIALWTKWDKDLPGGGWEPMISMNNQQKMRILCPTPQPQIQFFVGTATDPFADGVAWGWAEAIRQLSDEWTHWAFTKDCVTAEMSIYCNGQRVAHNHTANKVSTIPVPDDGGGWRGRGLNFGGREAFHGFWGKGLMDDIRIYDYALSQPEVAYVATDGTGSLYTALISAANLYDEEPKGSKKVNFKDYAILADAWLEDQCWP